MRNPLYNARVLRKTSSKHTVFSTSEKLPPIPRKSQSKHYTAKRTNLLETQKSQNMMKHLKLKPDELNDILNSFGRSNKSTKFLQRKIETTQSKALFF